ncbi:hypothetical protein OsJ_11267 [Oryza sativa Japonica Group]|uniref:Uncharacterized protein n=1 Tax=Oryza sativa subsp. japonica TaxID=39947 RepID=A3AJ36_ORYSJ|nr:hypothetical protein OsJ_11267 [Oryza sativa Japonica Group]
MTTSEREPCPDRILDDVGGAFAMGAVGGTAFHFLRGAYNSPNGHRLSGGSQAVRMSVPRTGGNFAAWGGLFSAFDCAMGPRATATSALVGASLLALVEGAGILLTRTMATLPQEDHAYPFPVVPPPEEVSAHESSPIAWVRGIFGRKEEKPAAAGGDRKSDVLESFETPSPPIPSFDYR